MAIKHFFFFFKDGLHHELQFLHDSRNDLSAWHEGNGESVGKKT